MRRRRKRRKKRTRKRRRRRRRSWWRKTEKVGKIYWQAEAASPSTHHFLKLQNILYTCTAGTTPVQSGPCAAN